MNLKLKKANNQIYIVDVDAEIKSGNKFHYKHFGEDIIGIANENTDLVNLNNPDNYFNKLIAPPEQIDIDNLWDKYLEALAEKESLEWFNKSEFRSDIKADYYSFKEGYLQAKKETYFNESDLRNTINALNVYKEEHKNSFNVTKWFNSHLQQLKVSKIPECGVELEKEEYIEENTGSEFKWVNKRPKFTNEKINILKFI